jgi:hypothetical protein
MLAVGLVEGVGLREAAGRAQQLLMLTDDDLRPLRAVVHCTRSGQPRQAAPNVAVPLG